jgi:GYF domain 2
MTYQVSRNGQMYGPYTLEDLQRYVAAGNILPTDLAKGEDAPDWVPVAQILGTAVSSVVPTQAIYVAPSAVPYPDPPNLHWGLVLLFTIFTCGLFGLIWDFVQVLWMKRVEPQSKAFMYFVVLVVLWLLNLGGSVGRTAVMMHGASPRPSLLALFLSLSVLVLLIVYRFVMRDSLERHFNGPEPIGLRLGPVMTFFFGGLYFQYHLNRINEIKNALRYRNMPR